ncbi:hypothetical protein DFH07DRAFT_894747 [Mycena maculata]|uniref:BTB domain-containing protein n=1 Tax=Mycena maculata TaxID=230809 RepID=A0AAD7MSY4_9AGAR|nr:hypothetical protein DFH07DRAFT_894747 [Mycena maculata]
MSTTAPPVTAAEPPLQPGPPFKDKSADIIIRSSDGADFYVSRAVLSLASPLFTDMFSIPQPESEPEVPVIAVTELSHRFDLFLRVWYPGAEAAAFGGLEQLADITELALSKYDMQFLTPVLQTHIQAYLETEPVAVYAVACQYKWGDIAKMAARRCLKLHLNSLFLPDMSRYLRNISAHHYLALLVYHHACGAAASSAARLLPWGKAEWAWIACVSCTAYTLQYNVPGLTGQRIPRAWIFDYLDRAGVLLQGTPGANLLEPAFLAPSQEKAAACMSHCRSSGFKHLAQFIVEDCVPAVNEAINGVSLEIDF